MSCPNKTSPLWINMVDKLGEDNAKLYYFLNNDLLEIEEVDRILGIESVDTQYQLINDTNREELVASEKTIRDIAARMSDRIGIPVRFESDRSKQYKGKLENGVAFINLAYTDLSTPIHEILAHPIIRAIKNRQQEKIIKYSIEKHDFGKDKYRIIDEKGSYFSSDIYSSLELAEEALSKKIQNLQNQNTKSLNQNQLYQNLLKELETGKGAEVLDRIKRDYVIKYNYPIFNTEIIKVDKVYRILNTKNNLLYAPIDFKSEEDALKYINVRKKEYSYTLEEQQEEAIVELLGMMTAEKLDAVKDGKLISLLKRLLKEMKQFVRSLLNQKEVEIDKLPESNKLDLINNKLQEMLKQGKIKKEC